MQQPTSSVKKQKFKSPALIKLELDEKINDYFIKNNIPKTGNEDLYQKTFIFLFLFVLFSTLILATHAPPGIKTLLWALLGVTQACIGFNIMHDASHGSFSSRKWVNSLFSRSLDMMAASVTLWHTKHNILHHTAPNTAHDDDIKIPGMRVVEAQPWKWYHRFQHIYCFGLYGLLYFTWIYYNDFVKYFTRKINGVKQTSINFSPKDHIIFWSSKIAHVIVFVIFPWWKFGFVAWFTGYLVFGVVCGLTISVVFQLAHVVTGIHVIKIDDAGNIPVENVVHQLMTTADFARKSKVAEFLFGGLNFQIEHHLQPKISHVHYYKLSRIVKKFCEENDLPYIEHPTFWHALWAHIQRLRELGMNKQFA